MLRAILFVAGLLWCWSAQAQITGATCNIGDPGMCAPTVGSGCSQATTFLARTSGLDATHQAAYTTLICGLVTDGVFSKLDALYITATSTTTTANLNLVSTSFTMTVTGTPLTFTADTGYSGGAPNFLDTNLNASLGGALYTQDSAHISVWDMTAGAGDGNQLVGASTQEHIYPRFTNGNAFFRINNGTGTNVAVATATGFYTGNRSGAGATQSYKNGASVVTGTDASAALNNSTFTLPFAGAGTPSADVFSAASFGGSLTGTQAANLCSRIGAYLHTINGLTSPC